MFTILKSPKYLLTILAVFTFVVFATNLFFAAAEQPYAAELSFVEISNNDGVIGSVVPASCESNPPDWAAPGPCVCTISAGACSGPSCTKTVSVNTNYDYATWGAWTLTRNGVPVANVASPSWSGSFNVPPAGYTFRVLRPDGIAICSAFVAGPPAPTLTFTRTPAAIDPGGSSTLNWTVTNAPAGCTASGGWSGSKSNTSGSEVVSPNVTTSYTLRCDGPGGTITRTVPVTVNPPVVTLTANPPLIGLGNSSNLVWTVTGATSCTASGGWSGARSATGGSQAVSPTVTTSYTISCTGPSGTTNRTATVTLPSGFIAATPCVIPAEASNCNTTVVWNAYNFLSTPSVSQQGTQFSTLTSSVGTVRAATPSSTRFTLDDTGSAFLTSFDADIQCANGSVWAGGRCITLPIITIEANPDIIRSGNTAPIEIEILANYELTCTISGGLNTTFTHAGAVTALPYSFTTRELTAAQITRIDCVSPIYPQVNGNAETRIEVIPTVEEI